MSKKYLYLFMSLLGLVIIITFMSTSRLNNERDDVQKRNDQLYRESLGLIAGAMNFDYEQLTEKSRLEHFTKFYEKIGVVGSVYPYTSYYDQKFDYTLELTMEELKVYFQQQWLDDFQKYKQTQGDVYNLILNVGLNPEENENINMLYDFLVQHNE